MSEQNLPGVMAGKRGLNMGVANERSIAWGIAAKLAEQGAELAFTFQGEALEKRVRPLAASVNSDTVLPCDVTSHIVDKPYRNLDKMYDLKHSTLSICETLAWPQSRGS